MANSCHIGLIDNKRNRYRMRAYQNKLTKFLTFFKSRKIITFSHLNSVNVNDNFKDNFMREKVNKMASKTKALNICALESNRK